MVSREEIEQLARKVAEETANATRLEISADADPNVSRDELRYAFESTNVSIEKVNGSIDDLKEELRRSQDRVDGRIDSLRNWILSFLGALIVAIITLAGSVWLAGTKQATEMGAIRERSLSNQQHIQRLLGRPTEIPGEVEPAPAPTNVRPHSQSP